jgi:hypothetical protein
LGESRLGQVWATFRVPKNADLVLILLFQKWKEVKDKDDTPFCTSFILA